MTVLTVVGAPALGGAKEATSRQPSLESKERAAKTACMSGDYAKGVALLAEMFVSTGKPIYIFNQGRCFEQSGKYEEAIVRFREFLRKHAEKDESGLAAETHIAECEALLSRQKGKDPQSSSEVTKSGGEPVPAHAFAPEPPRAAPPDGLSVVSTSLASPPEPVTERAPFYKTWWFWTSVGAAVVGGTVAALLLTRSAPDSCDGLGMKCVGVK